MKKLVSAAVLSLPLFYAVEAVDVEETVEESHPAYEGVYFGLGFHGNSMGLKDEYTHGTRFRFSAESFVGAGYDFINTAPDPDSGWVEKEIDDSKTRLGGSIVLGIGKKLKTNQFYGSLEFGLDFAPNAVSSSNGNMTARGRGYDVSLSRNGVTPSIAVRLGVVDCNTKILTFLKGGISRAKIGEYYCEYDTSHPLDLAYSHQKFSSTTPFVGLGIEKAFAKKMTFRVEGEYKWGKSKTKDFKDFGSTKISHKYEVNIRALICYNVKVGA